LLVGVAEWLEREPPGPRFPIPAEIYRQKPCTKKPPQQKTYRTKNLLQQKPAVPIHFRVLCGNG
jgi:hypothetical protein